jgi:lysophospholipase L1-like esterase
LALSACSTTAAGKNNEPALAYEKAAADALVSAGNNARLKAVIEKAEAGGEVTIAYIGGSITEGDDAVPYSNCYAAKFYEWFKAAYGNGRDTVRYINAGMSGTPSDLGLMRYNHDVLDMAAAPPDLVFIEFAVNDGEDTTNGKAYESLIRRILKAENKSAVVLVFTMTNSLWNLENRLKPLGLAYDLPMVSMLQALRPRFNSGEITKDEYYAKGQEAHPSTMGYQIMADSLAYLCKTVRAQKKNTAVEKFPATPVYGSDFEDLIPLDSKTDIAGITIDAGSFSFTDTDTGAFLWNKNQKLPNNWKHDGLKSENDDPLVVTAVCKNFILAYKWIGSWTSAYKNGGKAEVYVDGKLVNTLNSINASGWNNPRTVLVFNNPVAAEHTIRIQMADGNEFNEFTVLLMGLTK